MQILSELIYVYIYFILHCINKHWVNAVLSICPSTYPNIIDRCLVCVDSCVLVEILFYKNVRLHFKSSHWQIFHFFCTLFVVPILYTINIVWYSASWIICDLPVVWIYYTKCIFLLQNSVLMWKIPIVGVNEAIKRLKAGLLNACWNDLS